MRVNKVSKKTGIAGFFILYMCIVPGRDQTLRDVCFLPGPMCPE